MSRNSPFQVPVGFICSGTPLGTGSFGEVFLAHRKRRPDEGEDPGSIPDDDLEPVAIKRITDFPNTTDIHCADSNAFLRRVAREVSNLKHFRDCEQVVEVQDIYVSEDGLDLYLVMTAYSYSLEQLYSRPDEETTRLRNCLEENHVRYMVCQVLCGLYEIHRAGCMHRDLTLNNLLLDTSNFSCVISDFGLSRVQLEADPTGNLSLTVQSLPYRAPEIILESRPYDEKIDVWSIGCILVQLLSKSSIMRIGGTREDTVSQLWTIMDTVSGLPTLEELEYWEKERRAATKIINFLRNHRLRANRMKELRELLERGTGGKEDELSDLKAEYETLAVFPRRSGRESYPEARDIKEELVAECTKNLVNPLAPSEQAIDVARKCLQFDPKKRASVSDLMAMEWFLSDEYCKKMVEETLEMSREGDTADPLVGLETDEELIHFIKEQCTLDIKTGLQIGPKN